MTTATLRRSCCAGVVPPRSGDTRRLRWSRQAPSRHDQDHRATESPAKSLEQWCSSLECAVRAEVFVVWLHDGRIELTGPSGVAPWMLELGWTEHPVEFVGRMVRDMLGEPLLVHSTSWRWDRGAVILSFIVVVDQGTLAASASVPVSRFALARSEAVSAPQLIAHGQVLEHALRHLAWLALDDPAVVAVLSNRWKHALSRYRPGPSSLGPGAVGTPQGTMSGSRP